MNAKYSIAAFFIPLGIRAIPEIAAGPYPIGFDTLTFYVTNTLDVLSGRVGLLVILGNAPLLYLLSASVSGLFNLDPVWVFKTLGPLLYGAMIWSLFRFLRVGIGWSARDSLGTALVCASYFVTLRIGWDMYKGVLGMSFILLALSTYAKFPSTKGAAVFSGLIALAVASDQLTGVIALSIVAARAIALLWKRRTREWIRILEVATPGIVLFLLIAYTGWIISNQSLGKPQASFASFDDFTSSVGFLSYSYLLLAPLCLVGFTRMRNFEIRAWTALCIALATTALLPLVGLIVPSYRWSLLLDVPMCIFAYAGLKRVSGLRFQVGAWSTKGRSLTAMFYIMLMLSSVLYLGLPAQQASQYYSIFPSLLPTSMLQNTVPLSDMNEVRQSLLWVAANLNPKSVLITHIAMYGWAREYLRFSREQIIDYGFSDPLTGVEVARAAGYSTVFMVWWVNGLGEYDQPFVPIQFSLVIRNGDIAVYEYN